MKTSFESVLFSYIYFHSLLVILYRTFSNISLHRRSNILLDVDNIISFSVDKLEISSVIELTLSSS